MDLQVDTLNNSSTINVIFICPIELRFSFYINWQTVNISCVRCYFEKKKTLLLEFTDLSRVLFRQHILVPVVPLCVFCHILKLAL